MSREHKRKRNSIPRIAFVGLTIIIQIVWLIVMAVKLNAHSAWISACVNLLSIVVVLRLYGRHTSTAMKMPWIMLILAAPVMGLSLFLLFDILGDPGRAGKRIRRFREKIEGRPFPERGGAGAAGIGKPRCRQPVSLSFRP